MIKAPIDMTPWKLRTAADLFDIFGKFLATVSEGYDPSINNEIQTDLRRWADELEVQQS